MTTENPQPSKIGDANIVIPDLAKPSSYVDRAFAGRTLEYYKVLSQSTTLYVGNLSFHTSEEQIYELFSKCGQIKRIIMGLDKIRFTPCGFCFIEYYSHSDALDCLRYISETKLDDRFIRVDLDWGFQEGRQFGRGRHGGQVRDEHRQDFDAGRGGWGPVMMDVPQRHEQSYANMYHQNNQFHYQNPNSTNLQMGKRKRENDGALAENRNTRRRT